MIFVDVTSSCKSVINTGIQRTTRRIFSELQRRRETRAICWNLFGRFYHYPGPREQKVLENPFQVVKQATIQPKQHGGTVLAEFGRWMLREKVPLLRDLGKDDVLLVPELFQDARTGYLPKLIELTAARSVAIFHDATALRLGQLSARGRARFFRYIEALAAFDLVICVSQESCDDLHRLWHDRGIVAAATTVEKWAVEWDRPKSFPRRPGPKVVLSVGTLEPRKNYPILLRALEDLWEQGEAFEFELIGRSTRTYGGKILARIREMQERGRPIRWLKHIEDEQLRRAYGECSFTVYPSLMEGFGLPILESLVHGKPCICGSNGALGEVGAGGGCLFIDQGSVSALVEAIGSLLEGGPLYQRLCDESASRGFRSWSDYADRLSAHLNKDPG